MISMISCLFLLLPASSSEEWVYANVELNKLKITQGTLPSGNYTVDWHKHDLVESSFPYVALQGPGEAYFAAESNNEWNAVGFDGRFPNAQIALRVPNAGKIQGQLFVPKVDWQGMATLSFEIDASSSTPEAKTEFLRVKEKHYRRLHNTESPGGAWFRYQANLAHEQRGETTQATEPSEAARWNAPEWDRESALERSYDLFTGGKALSENLQLDRAMPPSGEDAKMVSMDTLQGIKIKAFDWKPLLGDAKPKLDFLADFIPADQYALFFPSFQSMIDLMDEANEAGTPVLQWADARSEDANTKSRYEKQLCLEMSGIARLLGPEIVESVAFTGSDPYLRTGSDVAILFHCKPGKRDFLKKYLESKWDAVRGESNQLNLEGHLRKDPKGNPVDLRYRGIQSKDRQINSIGLFLDDVVVVANSELQILKVALAFKNLSPKLSQLEEYQFFRNRYAKGDENETALLIVTDEAIRNWCSPHWRIANSRRTRAAAVMADLHAQHLFETQKTGELEKAPTLLGGGKFEVTSDGIWNSIYGSLNFMTPIAELELKEVTAQEANFYTRWREGYERNWSNFFDPIAVRFSVQNKKVEIDITVMPLIAGSEYKEIIEVTGNAGIPKNAGDPHPEAILHYVMALDPDSRPVKQLSNFASAMTPQLKGSPFSWVGRAAALYVDRDPVWEEMAKAESLDRFAEKNFSRLPVALWIEVKNPLVFATFLTAVRAFAEQTVPGMTKWESLQHGEQPYVKITASVDPTGDESDPGMKFAIYYATTTNSFLVTLHEGLLKRYLDRNHLEKAKENRESRPWLGKSFCAQVDGEGLKSILLPLFREDSRRFLTEKSWANLAILNEWKRRFPKEDPVETHRKFWGSTLLCPGGGEYRWNEKWQTMESTVYGHPGEPKMGPALPAILDTAKFGNFGLSFENQGLRAIGSIEKN